MFRYGIAHWSNENQPIAGTFARRSIPLEAFLSSNPWCPFHDMEGEWVDEVVHAPERSGKEAIA